MRDDLTLMKDFKKNFIKYRYAGFCHSINDEIGTNLDEFIPAFKCSDDERMRIREILNMYEPKTHYLRNSAFWFKPYNKVPRLRIIDRIITHLKVKEI